MKLLPLRFSWAGLSDSRRAAVCWAISVTSLTFLIPGSAATKLIPPRMMGAPNPRETDQPTKLDAALTRALTSLTLASIARDSIREALMRVPSVILPAPVKGTLPRLSIASEFMAMTATRAAR